MSSFDALGYFWRGRREVSCHFLILLMCGESVMGCGGAVILAFTVADDDGVITEVNILDAQAQTFHKAQTASV